MGLREVQVCNRLFLTTQSRKAIQPLLSKLNMDASGSELGFGGFIRFIGSRVDWAYRASRVKGQCRVYRVDRVDRL